MYCRIFVTFFVDKILFKPGNGRRSREFLLEDSVGQLNGFLELGLCGYFSVRCSPVDFRRFVRLFSGKASL